MRKPPKLLESERAQKVGWKILSTAGGALGGILARSVIEKGWGALDPSDIDPPLNPADRRIGWADALKWAVAAGIGAGIGRLVSQRLAAAGWEAATGSPPPGVAT